MRLWSIAGNGLLAGLISGLVLGFLILVFLGPLILSAEKYESDHGEHAAGSQNQRQLGTMLGAVILGTIYGLVLAAAYAVIDKIRIPWPVLRGLVFGLLGYALISLVPSLAFLPNPPGVEMVASATSRQGWWLAIIGLEITGLIIYHAIFKYWKFNRPLIGHALGLAFLAMLVLIPFVVGIPNQVDRTLVPDALLTNFRLISLLILLCFWVVLGLSVGFLHAWHNRDELLAGGS